MTFNPARTDLRPCREPALMTRLGVDQYEPVEAAMRALDVFTRAASGALKVVLSR